MIEVKVAYFHGKTVKFQYGCRDTQSLLNDGRVICVWIQWDYNRYFKKRKSQQEGNLSRHIRMNGSRLMICCEMSLSLSQCLYVCLAINSHPPVVSKTIDFHLSVVWEWSIWHSWLLDFILQLSTSESINVCYSTSTRRLYISPVVELARNWNYHMTSVKTCGEKGCWELCNFTTPSDLHSHGSWNECKNPYPLRNRIIPNEASAGAPGPRW